MGLFDKKKKADEFESPVEEINLAARSAAPPPGPPARPPEPEPATDFGINKAIELMRALPAQNPELVVTVVKTTLEALRIKVPTIISDADRKLKNIEGRVDGLKKEIADFEREIAQRKDLIAGLEADHKETSMVKERLGLAEKLAGDKKPAPPKAP